MKSSRSFGTLTLLALVTTTGLCAPSVAFAQTSPGAPASSAPAAGAPSTPATPASPAATAGATDESPRVKEAAQRFERGLALYDDGDFDAALVEFHRAYELAPTYKVLYNIAKIERHANDYSAALTNFERYLQQGGAEVPADRRAEVEKEIGVLKGRVATITVKANVEGASVYIDDNPICSERTIGPTCLGTTPLPGPVLVNPGKRRITASKTGYMQATAQLTVAGGDTQTINLELFDVRHKTADTWPRDRAIIAWGVTGALAIGAGILGGVALSKKSDYNDDRALPPCANQTINSNSCNTDTAGKLADDRSSTKTFAAVTDVVGAAAIISGVAAIYFTVKAFKRGGSSEPKVGSFSTFGVGKGSGVFSGSF